MPQQTINVGVAANDGTGDPLRIAYTKCNDNFTELYAGGAGIPEAPTDGNAYGRSNAAWLQVLKYTGDIVDGGNF